MAEAQIAAGHYEPDGYGDARKFLVNLYTEPNGGDPQRPVRLVNTPGSRLLDDGTTLSTGVRGLFQADGYADGKLIIPDGTTLRTYVPSTDTWGTVTGTLAGTDRVRAVFAEEQAGFLANGHFYVSASAGTSVALASDADWNTLLSDAGETGFSSIATMGQRALLTYGSRFGFSTTLQFNTTTTLSYYTAESNPDGIVAGVVSQNIYFVFGKKKTEPWVQTGDNDNPFRPLAEQVIDRGAMCRDSIVELDNTLFFIGDDRSPYRLNGLTPQILTGEDPWISRLLKNTDPADVICSAIEDDSHKFYVINTPTLCIVYDVLSDTWHKRQTYGSDTWEWVFHVADAGKFYAANQDTTLVELSRAYKSDRMPDASTFGIHKVWQFSAHVPIKQGRPAIGQVRLECATGVGLNSGEGSDPMVEMAISRNGGITFEKWRARSMGQIGEYDVQPKWETNGRGKPKQTVLLFRGSAPVTTLIERIPLGER